jgi:dTDP-3-amino-3,4,6-trideoxy-alpha-D-glucose transaminase
MIQQNDFQRQWRVVGNHVLDAVRRVGESGWYILGQEVELFESALARFWGLTHAVGVANGMDALEIGLHCLNLQPGDKVLTSPLSAFASTLAIIRAGGVPVFVDIDDLGQIDLVQCRNVLQRDPSLRFLVPVHLYGFALDLPELTRLKEEFRLSIVEDCAQSIGAAHGGAVCGSAGQVAATSFYPTKNLGALGDGGALLTNDADLAAQARKLRNYGQASKYSHSEIGLNSRLDELHAAVMRTALLPHLPAWTEARRKIARQYQNGIHQSAIQTLHPSPEMNPVWHLFPVTIANGRENLREHLRAQGVSSSIHYPQIIPDQVALAKYGRYEIQNEPVNARRFAETELSLPIHPFLEDDEVEAVIEACNSWRP